MARFYSLSFRSIPQIVGSSMTEDEAYEYLSRGGGDLWTEYCSDAESLARRFSDYYRDCIHFDYRERGYSAPVKGYKLEHYHTSHSRGHAHICFGYAINEYDRNDILDITRL